MNQAHHIQSIREIERLRLLAAEGRAILDEEAEQRLREQEEASLRFFEATERSALESQVAI